MLSLLSLSSLLAPPPRRPPLLLFVAIFAFLRATGTSSESGARMRFPIARLPIARCLSVSLPPGAALFAVVFSFCFGRTVDTAAAAAAAARAASDLCINSATCLLIDRRTGGIAGALFDRIRSCLAIEHATGTALNFMVLLSAVLFVVVVVEVTITDGCDSSSVSSSINSFCEKHFFVLVSGNFALCAKLRAKRPIVFYFLVNRTGLLGVRRLFHGAK